MNFQWFFLICTKSAEEPKLWGTRTENLSAFIKKGTHIFVEGRVGSEAYPNKETGEAKSVITINVTRVQLLDKRAAGGS